MAYLDDKILRGGEITSAGEFGDVSAFYITLVPKSSDAGSIAVLSAKLSGNEGFTDYPFVAGTWNPVVLNAVDVKSSDLTSYRIFWGTE